SIPRRNFQKKDPASRRPAQRRRGRRSSSRAAWKFVCTRVLYVCWWVSRRFFRDVERLCRLVFCQSRNPPTNALALSPTLQPGGNLLRFLTFPPPRTTSSGSSAAMRRATTSLTACSHFLLPNQARPETPR